MNDATRFNRPEKPTWCPGCGDFGIQTAIKKALLKLNLEPHQVAIASGIGCSGKMTQWVHTYGFHGLHGRAVPVALGIKLANHDLTVLAVGGDGDGYSEGTNHFIHACRRNVDVTYIVHNNGVFGLTTGQISPTGPQGFKSPTTPQGALERPLNPLALAIVSGANFVARGFSGDPEMLAELIAAGVAHKGFSLIDVFQVCASFFPARSFQWYKEHTYDLITDPNHNPADRDKALKAALQTADRMPLGIFYRGDAPAHEDGLPQLAQGPLVQRDISNVSIASLMEELV